MRGIYAIQCTLTREEYVGSATRICGRWAVHVVMLTRGAHHSKTLQRDWSRYGPAAFSFRVLETVPTAQSLTAREQEWIDRLRPGYNNAAARSSTPRTAGKSVPKRVGGKTAAVKRKK